MLTTSFGIFYTYQISQERNKAQLQAQKAEAVTTFLTDLIEASAPSNAQGDTITVREFLDQGFNEVQKLDKSPLVKAEILNTMGHTFRSLSETQKASTLLNQALTILEKHGQNSIKMARSYNIYGIIQRDLGNYDTAKTALKKSIDLYRSNAQENSGSFSKALRDLAYVERLKGNYEHASSLVREALAIERTLYEAPDVRIAETLYVLASVLRYQNKFEEAIDVQKQSLKMVRAITDKAHPGIANNLVNLAHLYDLQNKIQKARKYYQQALSMSKDLHGDTHRRLANIHSSLSSVYLYEGKLDSAVLHFKKARKIQRRIDPHSKNMTTILDNGAKVYARKKQFSKADTMLKKDKAILQELFRPNHPRLVDWKISKAKIQQQQGNLSTAEELYSEVLQVRKKRYKRTENPVQEVLHMLIDVLEASGQQAKADSLSQQLP
ncbi:MAG: tetratricopeptide repeat protein [Fodinibius sp.]|nr:tetratricopeptide repeat protein [Fodinibius sp.]